MDEFNNCNLFQLKIINYFLLFSFLISENLRKAKISKPFFILIIENDTKSEIKRKI